MNVDLTPAEARWLSVLAAADLRRDRERGLHAAERHQPAWDKLQPACEWERDDVD
jgi:hypothetical protein